MCYGVYGGGGVNRGESKVSTFSGYNYRQFKSSKSNSTIQIIGLGLKFNGFEKYVNLEKGTRMKLNRQTNIVVKTYCPLDCDKYYRISSHKFIMVIAFEYKQSIFFC